MNRASPLSKRAEAMPPFIVMDIMERAQELEREGADIVHMEIGAPDFDTPKPAKDAAIRALEQGKTAYTHSLGLLELREAIALHYREKYGVQVETDRIVVTSGTSPAFFLVLSSLLDQGDEALLADPGYACYPNYVRFVGGAPVFVPVKEEDGFGYRPEKVRHGLTPRTKAIFLNSPANPTGHVASPETIRELAAIAESSGAYLISDEIYHGLVYEGREHSSLEFTERAFVLNGFSKLYAMPGWRLGYLIAPREFVRPIQRIQQNLFLSASSFGQYGALAALTECGKEVAAMWSAYRERRDYLLPELRNLGFGIVMPPTGAFYIFANARRFGEKSYDLALDILEKAGLAVSPGIDFGPSGEGYLRFCYANTLPNLREAVSRLRSYLAG